MLNDFPTYVYQDINGEFLGASKLENIDVAHAAFELLDQVMKQFNDGCHEGTSIRTKTEAVENDSSTVPGDGTVR